MCVKKSLPHIGSPKSRLPHQFAITNFIQRTSDLFLEFGFQIAPEPAITDKNDDKIPDIVVYDANHYPLIIIEICTTAAVGHDKAKCRKLMSKFPGSVAYVYDYVEHVAYGLPRPEAKWLSSEKFPSLRCMYIEKPIVPLFDPITYDGKIKPLRVTPMVTELPGIGKVKMTI